MAIKLQVRRGTAANWAAVGVGNTVILLPGEIGYETDTGNYKIGDGSTVWNNLSYSQPTYPQVIVSGTDINASGYLAQGRYLVSTSVTSNVPSGWTPATDGPGVLTTTKLADGKVIQMLVSTTTQKAFLRGYAPTTYTTWVAISQHAGSITATELASSAVETAKINDNAVTFAKIQDITGLSVVGKGNSGSGDPTVITATASGQVLRHDGTNVSFGTLTPAAFDANTNVPLTALANQADQTIIGNVSGSAAAPTALSQASARTFLGLGTAAYTASTAYAPTPIVDSSTLDITGAGQTKTITASSLTIGATYWFVGTVSAGGSGTVRLSSSAERTIIFAWGATGTVTASGTFIPGMVTGSTTQNLLTSVAGNASGGSILLSLMRVS